MLEWYQMLDKGAFMTKPHLSVHVFEVLHCHGAMLALGVDLELPVQVADLRVGEVCVVLQVVHYFRLQGRSLGSHDEILYCKGDY